MPSSKPDVPLKAEAILRKRIADEETRLAELNERQRQTAARLQALRTDLETQRTGIDAPAQGPIAPIVAAPMTTGEKLALYRHLFRGRDDVYPRLWTNSRTGKKGYAPACANEWVAGICEKPRVKCGECPNQAFLSVTDQVVLDHLQGRHVIGVYPLLTDETCWLLAADFDKRSWMEDVGAFVETCRSVSIPASVERSRSGNGAHVWFFFTSPVAASVARRMGCYLLTETMSRRHQLGMDSYDRLFPNQDTMPRGGFGNLIAMPLQRGPRLQGNTVFLNEQLVPFHDQWAYLASVASIDPATVEAIADEAVRVGQIVGVRPAEIGDDEENAAPWRRPPSRRRRAVPIIGPLPREVRAVLAQRLFLEKTGLPSPLLNQIKRLAAFQNPEFYKKQSMRLSTALTPRVICCAEEMVDHIALPRGCRADLEDLFRAHEVALLVDDQRVAGEPIEWTFQGRLTPVQEEAAAALLAHDTGVFVAPPGIGKTVVGTYLVAMRGCSTLVLAHRRPLLDQWIAQLSLFLGVEAKAIGQIGAGKRAPNSRLDVAMIQSLVREGQVDDLVAGYGQVIVDECHHVSAVSFERVLSEVRARYVVGLTATPKRRDGHHPIAEMQLGPVRFSVDARSEGARRPFQHMLIVRETSYDVQGTSVSGGIQELYAALAVDERRNDLIIDDVIQALEEGRSPILLTERKDHLRYFADNLQGCARHLIVLHGGMRPKERRDAAARLAAIPSSEERLVLATGRYIGEGFDDARLDTLFLALPVSWRGTLVQYTGRLHRLHQGKTEVRIFDYVDTNVPVLRRMFERRLKGYRAIGYAVGEVPLASEVARCVPQRTSP